MLVDMLLYSACLFGTLVFLGWVLFFYESKEDRLKRKRSVEYFSILRLIESGYDVSLPGACLYRRPECDEAAPTSECYRLLLLGKNGKALGEQLFHSPEEAVETLMALREEEEEEAAAKHDT